MRITALGTGTSQGVPIIGCLCEVCQSKDPRDKRLRSSIFLETEQTRILFDIGPDFRYQYLSNHLPSIDAILLTHEHNDHVIGLDEVRALNYTQQKVLPVYLEERVSNELKKRFPYAFSSNNNIGAPQLDLKIIDTSPFRHNDILFTPIRVWHGQLPILAYRVKDFAYITDANRIDDDQIQKLSNLDVLIINALRKESHYTHFNLEECLAHIEKIAPKRAFITHISHKMGLTKDWTQSLPQNVLPLEDNLIINL